MDQQIILEDFPARPDQRGAGPHLAPDWKGHPEHSEVLVKLLHLVREKTDTGGHVDVIGADSVTELEVLQSSSWDVPIPGANSLGEEEVPRWEDDDPGGRPRRTSPSDTGRLSPSIRAGENGNCPR